jgi:tryptophan synthase beta chain
MVRISFRPETLSQGHDGTWGGQCIRSPSNETKAGRMPWKKTRTRRAAWALPFPKPSRQRSVTPAGKTRYSLGSVLNHVMLHQTIIGLEAKKQFEIADRYPDIVIGCAGGGSNFAGLAFPLSRIKSTANRSRFTRWSPRPAPP